MLLLTYEVVLHGCTSQVHRCTRVAPKSTHGFMKAVRASFAPTGASVHSSRNKLCYMKVCYKNCLRVASVI